MLKNQKKLKNIEIKQEKINHKFLVLSSVYWKVVFDPSSSLLEIYSITAK